jgi:gliding motility-associated protein GldE
MKNRQLRSDRAILKLLSMVNYMLATILILNNLVNIGIVLIANSILDSIIDFPHPGWEFAVKMVLVTFILLLFGEILPKVFARQYPMKIAGLVAVPLLWFKSFFKPLSWVLVKIGDGMDRRAAAFRKNISMVELSDAIEMTDVHSTEEKKMLEGIVEFVNTDVADIMHARLDITAINIERGFDAVRRIITESGFSRIPVFADNIDNIQGILYVKDLLPFINEGDDFDWREHLREAYYIPGHKKIHDLLEEFQTNKIHMAIIVDEYGSTQGLVSLEDILEEVVGEITDEHDHERDFYRKTGDGTYIFEGKTHICDMAEVVGVEEGVFDSVKGAAETVAGLMLEVRREFLKQGEELIINGIKFTAHKVEGRRIDKVKVEVK